MWRIPPYEYIADDGESIVGFEVDILAYIAEKLGMELEIIDMEFGSVLTSVQTGKIDIGVSGLTVTEERKQNVNFTTSYTTAKQSIIVTDDSPILSVDDLYAEGADYMVGVQESTTGHIYSEDDFGANEGLHVLDTAYALEDYAFAIAKENTELLEQVNAILEEMIADGTMAQMKAVYIK